MWRASSLELAAHLNCRLALNAARQKNADVKQFCFDVNIIHIDRCQSSGEMQRRRNLPFAAAR
jgi:hypothetical protein